VLVDPAHPSNSGARTADTSPALEQAMLEALLAVLRPPDRATAAGAG